MFLQRNIVECIRKSVTNPCVLDVTNQAGVYASQRVRLHTNEPEVLLPAWQNLNENLKLTI